MILPLRRQDGAFFASNPGFVEGRAHIDFRIIRAICWRRVAELRRRTQVAAEGRGRAGKYMRGACGSRISPMAADRNPSTRVAPAGHRLLKRIRGFRRDLSTSTRMT